jgi:hypothetical protein
MMNRRTVQAAMSYARSFAAAALAVWVAGNFRADWRDVAAAGMAAVLPPLLRWLNPSDAAFGRGSS